MSVNSVQKIGNWGTCATANSILGNGQTRYSVSVFKYNDFAVSPLYHSHTMLPALRKLLVENMTIAGAHHDVYLQIIE